MDSKMLPPIEKIYEAFSAIADNRVKMSDGLALVSSSDYSREYTVQWDEDTYSSNDNASYWQGYLGYPIIAVLMLQGRLNYNKALLAYLKNINWKKLNKENKNDYAKAITIILNGFASNGIDIELIKREAVNIYNQINKLDIKFKRSSKRPPK